MSALAAIIAGLAQTATAAPPPSTPPIVVTAPRQPADADERGLWMQADEYERGLATSNFVVRDAALNAYLHQVLCRVVGEAHCKPVRIYLMRTPYFNASMAPNGVLQIYSGLLLRVRDEAELAAVLAHEYTHYAQRHSLKGWRDMRGKAGAMMWLGFLPYGAGTLVQLGMVGSILSYNRDMEREADASSVAMLATAGYSPQAASMIWEHFRAEADATALARGTKSRKDKGGGFFASHPPSAERVATLAALAKVQPVVGTPVVNREAYRAALAGWWPRLIDDQIKLNDFGATEQLIGELAKDGWTPELNYARGELYRSRGRPEDLNAATGFYRQCVADPVTAPPEAWRGLGLALVRSGNAAEGQGVLKTYLERSPTAADRTMIATIAGVAQ